MHSATMILVTTDALGARLLFHMNVYFRIFRIETKHVYGMLKLIVAIAADVLFIIIPFSVLTPTEDYHSI